jgi:hypothetical protein
MTKAQCATANAEGQSLRLDGKLAAARRELEACRDTRCPRIVREDCAARLQEIDRVQPSVVLVANTASGEVLVPEAVTVDGHEGHPPTPTAAVPLDPGEHVFVITFAGRAPIERRLVLGEGDKERRLQITLDNASPPSAPPGPERSARSTGLTAPKIAGIATGGAGVVGLVIGGIFGVSTLAAVRQQTADCASSVTCPNHVAALSDHSTVSTDGAIATAAFVAGGALIAGGAVLFFVTSPSSHTDARQALRVVPDIGPHGATLRLQTSF